MHIFFAKNSLRNASYYRKMEIFFKKNFQTHKAEQREAKPPCLAFERQRMYVLCTFYAFTYLLQFLLLYKFFAVPFLNATERAIILNFTLFSFFLHITGSGNRHHSHEWSMVGFTFNTYELGNKKTAKHQTRW